MLSRYQLQHIDLITEIEQNPTGRRHWNGRVSTDLYQEKHRSLRTMGELLHARMFGATEYAQSLRKRMTNYVQGDRGQRSYPDAGVQTASSPPEPHQFPCQDPYCDPCNDAIKRLFRDIGVLPNGKPAPDLTDEPFTGRLRVPTRYRRDESDG